MSISKNKFWYKESVWYEVYIDLFYDSNSDGIGDIQGLILKLVYLKSIGVNTLWLLPFFKSPMKDYGYDVSSYKSIRKEIGSIKDFKELVTKAKTLGINIIIDIPLNHTSYKHPWFIKSEKNDPKYSNYYIWDYSNTKYSKANIIFKDYETSNWEYSKKRGEYYFHRFYKYQPDLNWKNPDVFDEFVKILDFWAGLGIRGFRIDAAPYLIKKEGTNCENLKETHKVIKKLKDSINNKYSDVIFISESNLKLNKIKEYFNEIEMSFNFNMMQKLMLSLKAENDKYIRDYIKEYNDIPGKNQFAGFLRNHDEMTFDNMNNREIKLFSKGYERYIYNNGIALRLSTLLNNNTDKIIQGFAILMSLNGTPIIYMGDEYGEIESNIKINKKIDKRMFVRNKFRWDKINSNIIIDNLRKISKVREKYIDIIGYKHSHYNKFKDISILSFKKDKLEFIYNLSSKEHILENKYKNIVLSRNIEIVGKKILMKRYSYIWVLS